MQVNSTIFCIHLPTRNNVTTHNLWSMNERQATSSSHQHHHWTIRLIIKSYQFCTLVCNKAGVVFNYLHYFHRPLLFYNPHYHYTWVIIKKAVFFCYQVHSLSYLQHNHRTHFFSVKISDFVRRQGLYSFRNRQSLSYENIYILFMISCKGQPIEDLITLSMKKNTVRRKDKVIN